MNTSTANSNKALNLLSRISEELGESLDLNVTAEQVCKIPIPLLSEWSALFLVDYNSGQLSYASSSHSVGQLTGTLAKHFSSAVGHESSPVRACIQSGEVLSTTYSFEDKPDQRSALVCLPLRRRSEIIGVLCLGNSAEFTPEDIFLAEDYSVRAANSLENASLFLRMRSAEEQLLRAKELAEQASEAKSRFLAQMSHEFRTPLSSILGFVDLILEPGNPDEEKLAWAARIKDCGNHLLHLINDFLDLSKIEADRVELESSIVELPRLLASVQASLCTAAEKKNLKLLIEIESSAPERFRSDHTRLLQILLNLVGNAIKFTSQGYVKVLVGYCPKSSFLYFKVKDTGTGLTLQQSAKLFQPFVQAESSHARLFGGSGLGLVISKKLANLLGGDLELLCSTPSEGSTFQLAIHPELVANTKFIETMNDQEVWQQDLASRGFEVANFEDRKILIVDDSADNLILVERMLAPCRAEVSKATSGDEAISLVRQENFDLILMDVQMPSKDGCETTQELRSLGYSGPIIALTAHALREQRAECLEAGCNDHLTKPINKNLLLSTISKHLTH